MVDAVPMEPRDKAAINVDASTDSAARALTEFRKVCACVALTHTGPVTPTYENLDGFSRSCLPPVGGIISIGDDASQVVVA